MNLQPKPTHYTHIPGAELTTTLDVPHKAANRRKYHKPTPHTANIKPRIESHRCAGAPQTCKPRTALTAQPTHRFGARSLITEARQTQAHTRIYILLSEFLYTNYIRTFCEHPRQNQALSSGFWSILDKNYSCFVFFTNKRQKLRKKHGGAKILHIFPFFAVKSLFSFFLVASGLLFLYLCAVFSRFFAFCVFCGSIPKYRS